MLDSKLVGHIIKQFREKKGLSQEVVSGLADIGRTHLSAIERGERKPTLETFFKISDALNIKASVLIQQIEEKINENNWNKIEQLIFRHKHKKERKMRSF